jgi:hypothetical protein
VSEVLDLMWEGDLHQALAAMAPGGQWQADQYLAQCPLHQDEDWSFRFDAGIRGWRCHCGCGDGDLLSLGIRLWRCGVDEAIARIEVLCGTPRRVVQRYPYVDHDGTLAFEVLRYAPKGFDCRLPRAWRWSDAVRMTSGQLPPVLYRLPEVLLADEVLVVEGEKDCETARAMGLVATCNAGGSGGWRQEFVEALRGRRVHIIADADENGRRHARRIAGSVIEAAEVVKVIEFAGAKDLTEWVEAGGTRDALLALFHDMPALNAEDVAGWWDPNSAIQLSRTADFLEEPEWLGRSA